MKLEAVTVCVNYADFLAHTLPFNKAQFDRYIVITTPGDRRTRDLCEFHHVECVVTDAFYADGAPFAKAAGINFGLRKLDCDDWMLHLDADIVLPPRTRTLLNRLPLDPEWIYGADRLMCPNFEAWTCYLSAPEVHHSCNSYIQAQAFPLGTRVGALDAHGWLPIGFFQLWHPRGSGAFYYPDHHNAGRGDYLFGSRWPRDRRGFLPEIVTVHLASGSGGPMGANWSGRQTAHFGPVPAKWALKPTPEMYHNAELT